MALPFTCWVVKGVLFPSSLTAFWQDRHPSILTVRPWSKGPRWDYSPKEASLGVTVDAPSHIWRRAVGGTSLSHFSPALPASPLPRPGSRIEQALLQSERTVSLRPETLRRRGRGGGRFWRPRGGGCPAAPAPSCCSDSPADPLRGGPGPQLATWGPVGSTWGLPLSRCLLLRQLCPTAGSSRSLSSAFPLPRMPSLPTPAHLQSLPPPSPEFSPRGCSLLAQVPALWIPTRPAAGSASPAGTLR